MRNVCRIICRLLFVLARQLPSGNLRGCPWGGQLRRVLARGMLESCGREVTIGRGCQFFSGAGVHLGDYSGIGEGAELAGPVRIGQFVMMAPEVLILTQNHEFADPAVPMARQGTRPVQPVVIEDDVWIGRRVIILPGVRVGRGSILGAGAVVAKDIPPYSIAVGNPARVVRSRRPDAAEDAP
jgi:maltose O-acetyltransferase